MRRQSIDPADLLLGHIGGIDVCAAALVAAANMIADGKFDAARAERYAGWEKPEAQAMLASGATLEFDRGAGRQAEDRAEAEIGTAGILSKSPQPLSLRTQYNSAPHPEERRRRVSKDASKERSAYTGASFETASRRLAARGQAAERFDGERNTL